jgi:hypothetical protein
MDRPALGQGFPSPSMRRRASIEGRKIDREERRHKETRCG